ncbi:circularly permutated Ras protein 1-like [Pyxicephalus adspersus]|uniref:circularly permutated Ras protein 1-like n=1 Tax=Pyxicephalus adspersus TaxID=30357 RepID=UPI003B5905CD
MEFGCRYIYVDESRGDTHDHCNPSVGVSQSQNGDDVPGSAFYDNWRDKEHDACSEITEQSHGLSQTGLPQHSNVYQDIQLGSVSARETPPPIPDRKKKPSMLQQSGEIDPDLALYDNFSCKADSASPELPQELSHNTLSLQTNVYQGLQLPPSPNPGSKTPPPIPVRKHKLLSTHTVICTPSASNSLLPFSKRCENGQMSTTSSIKQKNPPPIPLRKKKPSENLSGITKSEDYDYVYEEFPSLAVNPNVIPAISVDSDNSVNSFYLDVLPAHPMELEKQRTPSPTPNHSLASSPGLPAEQRLPANCNILLLNVGKMVDDPGIKNIGFPLLCITCSAAFSEFSHLEDKGTDLVLETWTCDFCNTVNVITERAELSCTGGDQLYLQETQFGNVYSTDEDTMLIFCIDISGSMSVTMEVSQDHPNNCDNHNIYQSRMEAVKSGLSETLDLLYRQHPRKRVALVTFSDQVKIYGDGTMEPQVLEDCELLDTDYLKSQGENQPMPRTLEETLHVLKARIECLKETGATALGPAALLSIAMASKRPGSKVIICTDGRANTDLGNLEDITEEYVYLSSKLYYSNLGDMAVQHSVVVSVVTIEGTDCRLPELGQLADKTGGKVNIVHPLNLAKEFQSILDEQINATDVEVKVYLPHSMHFLYEGHTESVLKRKLGSISPYTVLSTEFAIHSSKIKEVLRYSQIPVQVQLTFTLPDGRTRHRIISQMRPVTNDSIAALEAIDLNVLQSHSVQFCARLAMEGQVNEATKVALELKELIDQVMRHEKYEDQGVVYEDWENTMAPIYEDLQIYVQGELSEKNTTNTTTEVPVVKSFSDEMAKMIFHMKRAKSKVLNRWKHQAT